MKKFLALVFVVIALVSKIYGVDFKFLTGINISQYVYMGIDFAPGPRVGLLLGGGTEFNLSKNISFELNGLYFQKRYTQDIWDEEGGIRTISFTFHEINLPIFVKLKRLFRSSFYLFGGGELAYIVSGARSYKFDYGAVAGGGIEFGKLIPLSSIEIRFRLGMNALTIAFILAFSL